MEYMLLPLGLHFLFAFSGAGLNLLSVLNFLMIALNVFLFLVLAIGQLLMIPSAITDKINGVTSNLPIRIDLKLMAIVSAATKRLLHEGEGVGLWHLWQ